MTLALLSWDLYRRKFLQTRFARLLAPFACYDFNCNISKISKLDDFTFDVFRFSRLPPQKMIESLLDQTCTILPIDQQTCDDTVNGMFEALVNLFESYKPDEVLSLCVNFYIILSLTS